MNELLYHNSDHAAAATAAAAAYAATHLQTVEIGAEDLHDPTAFDINDTTGTGSYADEDGTMFGTGYDETQQVEVEPDAADVEPPADAGGGTPPDDTGNTPPPGGSDEYPSAGEPDDGEGDDAQQSGGAPASGAEPAAASGGEDNPVRTINLDDLLAGPRELIIGGTGSGKSEFLRALGDRLRAELAQGASEQATGPDGNTDEQAAGIPPLPAEPHTIIAIDESKLFPPITINPDPPLETFPNARQYGYGTAADTAAGDPTFGDKTAADQLADLRFPDPAPTRPDAAAIIDKYYEDALAQAAQTVAGTSPLPPTGDNLAAAVEETIGETSPLTDEWRNALRSNVTAIDLGKLPPETRAAMVRYAIEQMRAAGGLVIDETAGAGGAVTGQSVNDGRNTGYTPPLTNTPNLLPLRTGNPDDPQRLAATMGAPEGGPSVGVNLGNVPVSPFGSEAATLGDMAGLSDGEAAVVSGDGESLGTYDLTTGARRDGRDRDPRDEPWGTHEVAPDGTYEQLHGDGAEPNATTYEARNAPAPGTENNTPSGGGVGQN